MLRRILQNIFVRFKIDSQNLTTLKSVPLNLSGYKHIATNFELKYRLEGREIYRAVYEK